MQRRREGRKALTTRRVTVAPVYEEHAQFRANRAVNNGTLGPSAPWLGASCGVMHIDEARATYSRPLQSGNR